MQKNDIVTLLTSVGEIVGRVVEECDSTITLSSPKMLIHAQQGMGFAPGICMSACPKKTDKVVFQKNSVIAIVPTVKEIADGWVQTATGLVLSS